MRPNEKQPHGKTAPVRGKTLLPNLAEVNMKPEPRVREQEWPRRYRGGLDHRIPTTKKRGRGSSVFVGPVRLGQSLGYAASDASRNSRQTK